MLDYPSAKNEMQKLFRDRFLAYMAAGLPDNEPAIAPPVFLPRGSTTPYVPAIYWSSVERKETNETALTWLRFTSQNLIKRQASMAGGRVQAVGTRHTTKGLIRVEIYVAKSSYSTVNVDSLALIVERCFVQENTPCGVWFRNSVIVELEPNENYFRSNVLTEYEYDSVIK